METAMARPGEFKPVRGQRQNVAEQRRRLRSDGGWWWWWWWWWWYNGGGGTRTSARYCYLGGAGASEACTSCRRAGRAGKGRAVPSTPRTSSGRASTALHTQYRRKGVPHQPGPEPEPGALLRRGPLADGVAPLAVLSSIGAKWGQGFKSSARIDVDADMAARCLVLSLL
ncbi:hypothetical protein TGAM01_v210222 [Trichoderma gamsii]|uniref:Uncharacterized protein n=1 Tax=Trichoderma gamsii TaxID=398673 RepID=A0A2P4Z9I3_9HYPO|nr:hypothetical protein TGAM01_v210222 [Trichoderma gamsii]PON20937.1 hypothetical protein TGAM01_v210222 [Trichoderma gamsii]